MTLDRISGICLLLLAVFIAFETRVLPRAEALALPDIIRTQANLIPADGIQDEGCVQVVRYPAQVLAETGSVAVEHVLRSQGMQQVDLSRAPHDVDDRQVMLPPEAQ